MDLTLISSELKKQLAKSSFTQNEINSFKWGNSPTEETRLKSAMNDAFEVAKIQHYYLHSEKEVIAKMIERVEKFSSLEELEKSNERMLTGN